MFTTQRTTGRLPRLALSVVLATGTLTACGGDPSPEPPATTEESPAPTRRAAETIEAPVRQPTEDELRWRSRIPDGDYVTAVCQGYSDLQFTNFKAEEGIAPEVIAGDLRRAIASFRTATSTLPEPANEVIARSGDDLASRFDRIEPMVSPDASPAQMSEALPLLTGNPEIKGIYYDFSTEVGNLPPEQDAAARRIPACSHVFRDYDKVLDDRVVLPLADAAVRLQQARDGWTIAMEEAGMLPKDLSAEPVTDYPTAEGEPLIPILPPDPDELGPPKEYFFALADRDPEKWRAISDSMIEGADILDTWENTATDPIEFDAVQEVVVYRENLKYALYDAAAALSEAADRAEEILDDTGTDLSGKLDALTAFDDDVDAHIRNVELMARMLLKLTLEKAGLMTQEAVESAVQLQSREDVGQKILEDFDEDLRKIL